MTADGSFSDRVRVGVLLRDAEQCVGCRRSRMPLTLQHRRARGMGGTSRTAAEVASSPANALTLCGSGTTGCHGWTENHPREAAALGWRVDRFDHRPAWQVPVYGWWMGQRLWRLLLPSDEAGWQFAHPEDYPDMAADPDALLPPWWRALA